MRHQGLFPAPAPRITSAPTVSACAAHNSDKTVTRLITTHSARAHMHARTPKLSWSSHGLPRKSGSPAAFRRHRGLCLGAGRGPRRATTPCRSACRVV